MSTKLSLCLFAFILVQTATLEAETILIRSDSNSAEEEGIGQMSVGNAVTGQQINSAFDFPLDGPHILTSFAFRPDGVIPTPISVTYEYFDVWMGVTNVAPEIMTQDFAHNRPAKIDSVYVGPITITTENRILSNGTFAFDQEVVLQHPFVYDPTEGNTFIEVDWSAPSEPPMWDFAASTENAQGLQGPIPELSSPGGLTGTFPMEFRFQTVEPGDADFDGDVDSADATIVQTNWTGAQMLEHDLVSGAWLPGDFDLGGDVDTADQHLLSVNWTGAKMAAQTNVIPEPQAGCLTLIGMGLMLTRRARRPSRHADRRRNAGRRAMQTF